MLNTARCSNCDETIEEARRSRDAQFSTNISETLRKQRDESAGIKVRTTRRPSFLCDNSKSGVDLGLGREQASDARVRTINCYRIEWGNCPSNTESTRANSRISALSIGGVRIQQLTKCTGSTTGIEPLSFRGKKMVFGHKETLQSQLTMLYKKKHGKKSYNAYPWGI